MGIPARVVAVTAVSAVPTAFRCVIVIVAKAVIHFIRIRAIFKLFQALAFRTIIVPNRVVVVAAVSTIPVTMLNIVGIITKAITNMIYTDINTNVNENYSTITNSMSNCSYLVETLLTLVLSKIFEVRSSKGSPQQASACRLENLPPPRLRAH